MSTEPDPDYEREKAALNEFAKEHAPNAECHEYNNADAALRDILSRPDGALLTCTAGTIKFLIGFVITKALKDAHAHQIAKCKPSMN